MFGSPLLRRVQVYTAPWLGGAAGMRGGGGELSTMRAGKVSIVAVEGGGVRAPREGMTVLAASQTPTPAQNGRELLSGIDTAGRDKALREVLLRDLGGRRTSVTEAAECPGEGGEDELEALGHRESRVLQVVVDGLVEVEVVAMVTLRRQQGNSVLLTILERAEAAREVGALLRGMAGAAAERGATLGSVVRGVGGVASTLRLGGGSGVKTNPHLLMGSCGLIGLRGRCELVPPYFGALLKGKAGQETVDEGSLEEERHITNEAGILKDLDVAVQGGSATRAGPA
ncbi:hypothetical protein CBR_g22041 [Chara braunii]|uniref:Uncharacterized protein n=1 Tax=Chara braunii TaxID=69332 RepID=A0A388L268_CHABU|nr:hypothetical protein CBR_g22041 [Chara braunii]|eukprot:GBG76293.1 hypothetical protein CBR_g22041 [Chara braunii]